MAVTDLVFDERYFNDDRPDGPGYTRYSRDTYAGFDFRSLAQDLTGKALARGLQLAGKKVLVVGCAYGYIVEDLLALGADAWGLDISAYAVSQAPAVVAGRIYNGDVRVAADMDAARSLAGLRGKQKFDLIYDFDMLGCLTDTDAQTACGEMRRVGNMVVHQVSTHSIVGDWYNIKPLAQWKALCDPSGLDFWFRWPRWEEVG